MAKPIIPWLGGKRQLAKHIFPLFPEHTCYVEPFCGAGALYFMKEPVKSEVLNDINGELINLYRVVKYHLEPLYQQFKWMLCSRQNWEWALSTPPETMTDIQRAARFMYLQKQAFGGKLEHPTFGTTTTSRPRFSIYSFEQDLADAHYRLSNTTIEHMEWDKVITKYDRAHTLFYCDPPYWQTAGYGVEFGFEHYERLAELARSIKGHMIISINDHPDMHKLFEGLHIIKIGHRYTIGGNDHSKPCSELVIVNR